MNDALLQLLRDVDTPTVCNAIEVAEGRRGFGAFTRGTMISSAPEESRMVGYARTARIAGAEPPAEPPAAVRRRRMDYYRYMAEAPSPAVAVIEDVDFPDCVGAYWGEVNATVHQGLGLAGAVTNGVMRDLDDIPRGFPVLAGSVGPSHGFVHVRDFGEPVTVCGLTVREGDLVHADRHGAVVIPSEIVAGLAAAVDRLRANEALILGPARRPGFNFEALERAWTEFEKART